ncbi:hypothetical protein STEG23_001999, partial [Scotinomys teguina]
MAGLRANERAEQEGYKNLGRKEAALSSLGSYGSCLKAALQTIGEDQSQNPYTELLVLKAHHDIVRFLVQLDDH